MQQSGAAVHVGLANFVKLSCQRQSRSVRSARLGPCPIPAWSWTGPKHLSPSRRRRRKLLEVRRDLLKWVKGTLNWECLGHPRHLLLKRVLVPHILMSSGP